MTSQNFKLSAGNDFIPLDKLLKLLALVETGGMAHQVIEEGLVKVNAVVELQKRKKLRPGDVVEFEQQSIVIE